MPDDISLKDWLPSKDLSRGDKLLIVLSTASNAPKSIKTIREIAVHSGLPQAKNWNIADILAKSGGMAVKTEQGWELNEAGKHRVSLLVGTAPAQPKARELRAALANINNADALAFTSEAIECYERKLLHAAVVLSWVGALHLLYVEVASKHLPSFNAEATKRDSKWRAAKNEDDLARMKEHNFLDILEAISVIGKSVKDELQSCLKLRNGCGHPNSLKIGENRVAAHIEVLILNVFSRFI